MPVLFVLLLVQNEGAWKDARRALDESRAKTPGERAAAVRAIANATYSAVDLETAKAVCSMLEGEIARQGDERNVSADVLEACAAALKKVGSDSAIDYLTKKAKEGGPWRVRAYIIEALATLPGEKTTAMLIELIYKGGKQKLSSDPHVAAAALDALAQRKDPASLPTLHAALIDSDMPWEGRLSALQGIARIGDSASIPKLIEALRVIPDQQGRLKSTLIEVLQKMTSLPLNTGNADAWKAQWEGKAGDGGTRVAPPVPTEFFGLKTRSTKIVFVLDISSSMLEKASETHAPAPPELPKAPPEIGTGGGKVKIANPDPIDPTRDMDPTEQGAYKKATEILQKWMASKPTHRLDLMRKEFIRALYYIDHRVYFGMFFYCATVTPWKGQLVRATWVNKVDAMTTVENLKTAGWTNLGDALLEHALKMVSSSAPGGKFDGPPVVQRGGTHVEVISGPDTIYLLTDGEPNYGRYAEGAKTSDLKALANYTKGNIMNELRKIVARRKVTIHTICIGDPGSTPNDAVDPAWMRSVAELTGGSAVHVSGRGR